MTNKRGRPVKREGEKYKYLVILTQEEAEMLNDLCDCLQLSKADSVRRAIRVLHSMKITG